jgi:hypothetical protein
LQAHLPARSRVRGGWAKVRPGIGFQRGGKSTIVGILRKDFGENGRNFSSPNQTPIKIFSREETIMRRALTRTLALAAAFTGLAGLSAPQALAQSGPGWVMLFDGKTLDGWDRTGETNWRVEDGAIVADKKPEKGAAHLVSKQKYKDFQLYVEFWASDDANSGIFLRCQNPQQITDRSCYEANIFDTRPDPSYGTGAIVHYAEVNPMPKAGGKWNTYEITAKGRDITVMLNGQKTVSLRNGMWVEGPLTLQYGQGVMKFRKVAVKPL